MINIIGSIASFLWGISLIPELIRTIRNKKCFLGYGLLITTIFAAIGSIMYTYSIVAIPLLINYIVNFLTLITLLIYKIKNGKK